MRRILTIAFVAALLVPTTAVVVSAAQAQLGALAGTATDAATTPLANVIVQLRDVVTGQLVGTTTSSATGAFSFTGLAAGNFAVEVVNAAGQIIGTSASITVAAGASITGVTVTASAAALAGAAGGAAGALGAAAGGGAAAGASTATVIITSAAGAGLAGGVAISESGSPAQ